MADLKLIYKINLSNLKRLHGYNCNRNRLALKKVLTTCRALCEQVNS